MTHNLIPLPPITDATPLWNHHPSPSYSVPKPNTGQLWVKDVLNLPRPNYPYPNSVRLYPLQLVLLAEITSDAPRSLADNFRFVLVPVTPRQRRKKSTSNEVKERIVSVQQQAPRTALINDPSVNFPISSPETSDGNSGIPLEELLHLKTSVYPSINTKRYSASALDPTKSHLMVYEYSVGAHWVIWDHDTGYVHLTGLWRAALQERAFQKNGVLQSKTNTKADIVKLLELTPKALHPYIKRVRGGFLKIQGTWVPFHLCKKLALRFCYYIRYKLVPIFGPSFPAECLHPADVGFGELRFNDSSEMLTLPQLSPRLVKLRLSPEQIQPDHAGHDPFNSRQPATELRDQLQCLRQVQTVDVSAAPGSIPIGLPIPTVARKSLSHMGESLPIPLSVKSSYDHDCLGRDSLQSSAIASYSLSYSDMVDIVNASKCLQLLSQRASTSLESLDPKDANHSEKMKIVNLLT